MNAVRKPTSGANRLYGILAMPKIIKMQRTENEKNNPLVPAQIISPIIKLFLLLLFE